MLLALCLPRQHTVFAEMKLSASLNADPKGQSMELWNLKSLGRVLSTFASVWGAETYGRQVATRQKESPPPMSKSYMWSKLYASAVLETDLRKIPQRIREAEWAIRERFCSTMPIDLAERQIITGAKVRLKELKGRGLPKVIAHRPLQELDLPGSKVIVSAW